MTVVIAAQGSCDAEFLARAVPGVQLVTVASFAAAEPDCARTAEVVVLRSGVALDKPALDRLPKLSHVIRTGSGTDNIDTRELAARQISLYTNPGPGAVAAAEWALLACLMLARRAVVGHTRLMLGLHAKDACMGRDLRALRAGIWGAGPVGRAVAAAVGPFAADIRFLRWKSIADDLPQLDQDLLEDWADLHIVCLPLTSGTRALIGPRFLTAVAHRAPYVVCVGRCETIDVPACTAAVRSGGLSGLAVDPVDPDQMAPFRAATGNVFVTPHIGAQRDDVRRSLDVWTAQTLATILRDR